MAVPLRRNRDFLLLQAGQLLSTLGTQSTRIAYPLLVLGLTHSSIDTGIVSFADTVPLALLGIPAGVAADRWNRKRLMIGADVLRAGALGALVAAILLGRLLLWQVIAVAVVEGAGAAVFGAASYGALRSVVPRAQMPAAAGAQVGRQAVVQLAGPPLGGALFGIGRALPFVADLASYAFSTGSLLLMRTPFQEERTAEPAALRERVREGFRYMWGQPFLRTVALLFGIANFIAPGVVLALIVIGKRQGLSAGVVGLLVAAFGASLLLGSLVSPLVLRRLPVRAILVLELWTWPGCAVFLLWPNAYVLAAAMLPTALVIPSTDSVVHGYRIAMTPDHVLGRAEAIRSTISLLIAPLGPLLAGVLLEAATARLTIAVFAASALALALWGTLSPSIRTAPDLADLAEPP